jgi:hypothetical protein
MMPYLGRFENDWATEDILRQWSKNWRSKERRGGRLTVPAKHSHCRTNLQKRDPAGKRGKRCGPRHAKRRLEELEEDENEEGGDENENEEDEGRSRKRTKREDDDDDFDMDVDGSGDDDDDDDSDGGTPEFIEGSSRDGATRRRG